jgi:hypothetical protein
MKRKLTSLILLLTACSSFIKPLKSSASGPEDVPFSYQAYCFNPVEGWTLQGKGDIGASSLHCKSLTLDFTMGAQSVSITPTPVSMLGKVAKIRLKVKGSMGDHVVHIYIQTHFMTFHKVVGKLSGPGIQELVFDAPPGNGWLWNGGENDGKVHGPLRLLEIEIEGNNSRDICKLDLVSISVEGTTASDKRCILTSESLPVSDPVIFRAKIRSVDYKPLKGTLYWSILSWDKKELEKGKRSVTVAPRAKENIYTIKTGLRKPSLKFAEAIFQLDIPGQSVPDANACWLAQNELQDDTSLAPSSTFGMGAYLGRYHGHELQEMARKAKESGVKWTREDFEWGLMEPKKGRYYWAFADSVVQIAMKNGISVYAIVAYWPSWTKEYTREGIEDYLVFLKALVNRYKKDIHQWEIWNEPNIFFWQGPEEMYAELLMKSYITIKDADPSAQVLGLSTSGIDFGFIQRMQDLQAPFDVLTIHPYRSKLDETEFIRELKKAYDMVTLPGGRRRPVWITEMGWTTYTPHNSWVQEGFLPTPLREQAELIVRTYLSCIISGADPKVFWYDLRNDGTDPLNFEDNIGIMYRDFTPKPAYIAYSTMTRTLRSMKFIDSPVLAEGIFSGLFENKSENDKKILAVWSPYADRNIDIEIFSDKATLVNTIGETCDLKVTLRDMKKFVTIQLTKGSPVYIKEY